MTNRRPIGTPGESDSDVTRHPSQKKRRVLLACVGAVLFSALGVLFAWQYAFAHEGHGTEEVGEFDFDAPRIVSAETAKHIGLKTAEVGRHSIEEVIELSGVVKPLPDRHRAVVSRLSGRILQVTKQVGDPVKQGELLARIDSPEQSRNLYEVRKIEVEYLKLLLEFERAKAESERTASEVKSAHEQFTFADSEYERARGLSKDGAVSEKETAQRKSDRAQAEANIRKSEIELSLARRTTEGLQRQAEALRVSRESLLIMNNLDPRVDLGLPFTSVLEIKAEADGVVVRRTAIPGHWAQAGESILEIADYGEVQIEGEIPESLLSRIIGRQADKVRIRTPADPKFLGEGKIRFITPQLEPQKRTAHLIVDAKNTPGVLRGEMWVELSVVVREAKNALVVPRSAVIVHGPMHFVFLESGGQYQKQDINPGVSDDRFVEVKDGLAPGDEVVVQGAYSLTQLRPKAKAKESEVTTDKTKNENAHGEKK